MQRRAGLARRLVLALQLRFVFDVSVSCSGLVSASPEGPCNDVSRANAPLGDRGRLRNGKDRTRSRSQRDTLSGHGWHRHVSLVMLAFALLAVIRRRAAAVASPQKSAAAETRRQWC